jgi:hypothetical protein
LRPLPIEAVVRGYLIGSGWKDYQATGAVCGIPLPPGLQLASRLPQPIFTPATKAAIGDHDENIAFERAQADCARALADLLPPADGKSGAEVAGQARVWPSRCTLPPPRMPLRGIIIADTKFEFGLDASRHAAPDRRSADSRLVTLLASRRLSRGQQPAVLRQAIRARLSRNPAPGTSRPPAHTAGRGARRHARPVRRGLRAADRREVQSTDRPPGAPRIDAVCALLSQGDRMGLETSSTTERNDAAPAVRSVGAGSPFAWLAAGWRICAPTRLPASPMACCSPSPAT